MKNNLIKFMITGLLLAAVVSAQAQSYSSAGMNDGDLNTTLGISSAWIWLQNAIVPLAMLLVFTGAIIIITELYYRQSKMLNDILCAAAKNQQKIESTHN
ncbi:MAG TPA: hypothetical protein VHG71_09630 [Verrucomicrobiae bacterium]|nr:hypothetical protein [Verrucomicrobiae bacterium]